MLSSQAEWLVSIEGIFPRFDQPRCHATTLAETPDGLVLAFYGGNQIDSQGLWVMHKAPLGWGPAERVVASSGILESCWNPVLHPARDGSLLLFFQRGATPAEWRGHLLRSEDGGRTWSDPEPLPRDVWGPIRNKPLELDDGTMLCGSSRERGGRRVHFDLSDDIGRTWLQSRPSGEAAPHGAIQPALIAWSNDRIQALCRTNTGILVETWSADGGRSWSALAPTALPNPDSAVDVVMLPDGRAMLVYNPTSKPDGHGQGPRTPLSLAISDDGSEWRPVGILEDAEDPDAEFSYPAAIVTRDGRVHVTYTTDRRWTSIRHVVINPERLTA